MATAIDHNAHITPNFTWGEFLRTQDDTPGATVLNNLRNLAQRLQVVRDVLNKPVLITSGYRSPAHNRAVGGAPNSQHLYGRAADIVVPGVSAQEVQQLLAHWHGGLGQSPHYTHVDLAAKRRWTY